MSEVICVDGAAVGVMTVWHPNGVKTLECDYRDGDPHGMERTWHDNGEKRSERHYENGERNGKVIQWNRKGERIVETRYVHRNPVPGHPAKDLSKSKFKEIVGRMAIKGRFVAGFPIVAYCHTDVWFECFGEADSTFGEGVDAIYTYFCSDGRLRFKLSIGKEDTIVEEID